MTWLAFYVFFGFAFVVWAACVLKIERKHALFVMMFWPIVVLIWALRR